MFNIFLQFNFNNIKKYECKNVLIKSIVIQNRKFGNVRKMSFCISYHFIQKFSCSSFNLWSENCFGMDIHYFIVFLSTFVIYFCDLQYSIVSLFLKFFEKI